MNYTNLFSLERHVEDTIERIASDREASGGGLPTAGAAIAVGAVRRRLGAVLIGLGERVGGPAARGPQPPTPRPLHTPLLSF